MEQPRPTIPHQLNSSQVLFRLVSRIALLSTFATFRTEGFGTAFAVLLTLVGDFLRSGGCNSPRGGVWSHVNALG